MVSGELNRGYLRLHNDSRPSSPPSEPTKRDVAILIVGYRHPGMVRDCLAAVDRHLPRVPVFVWDNSGPGYTGMDDVVDSHPSVRWFLGSRNIGFAAAVNALAREVPQHNLLLLNPDAVLQGPLTETFATLLKPGVAAAAPLTIDDKAPAHRHRVWDVAHRAQTLVGALVAWAGYSYRVRGQRWSELYAEQPQLVEGYLTGACLAISRDAWNAVGTFDEEFFLYGEEAHWQRRARSIGWSLVLVNELGVVHSGHGTVADDSVGALRSRDLLRANIALNLELEKGSRQANIYLAGTSLLERVQRSKRTERAARHRPDDGKPTIIMTTNRLVDAAERHRVLLAIELTKRGYEVVLACMERFGPLVTEIPASIRIVRQPWWVPAIDINADKAVMITGETRTEIACGTLWRSSGRARGWLVVANSGSHPITPTHSRAMAWASRRSDGFITSRCEADFPRLPTSESIETLADAYESAIMVAL